MMKLLSTKEVAEKLNISTIRIRQLIQSGRLTATKIGRDYVIDEKDLSMVGNRQAGRPKKNESESKEVKQ